MTDAIAQVVEESPGPPEEKKFRKAAGKKPPEEIEVFISQNKRQDPEGEENKAKKKSYSCEAMGDRQDRCNLWFVNLKMRRKRAFFHSFSPLINPKYTFETLIFLVSFVNRPL